MGQLEAQSILFGLSKVPVPRPNTHDLCLTVFKKTNTTVERVEINDMKEDTIYSRLILKHKKENIVLGDVRPSDSLGIAARVQCPVFISEAIVEETGMIISHISDAEIYLNENHDGKKASRYSLEQALKTAIEHENYEEAARIRDMLKNL